MLNYILRRLIIAFFMLIGIAFVSFVVIQLPPGDVATNYEAFLLQQPGVSEEDAQRQANLLRRQYGLDQPLPMQFYTWMKGIVTEGKFGYSIATARTWAS
jgi:peptide/nickel transport system permease protein